MSLLGKVGGVRPRGAPGRALLLLVLAAALVFPGQGCARDGEDAVRTWVCYYGRRDCSGLIARFDLAVLDPSCRVEFARGERRPLLLGYLSLAEVNRASPVYARVKDKPFMVRDNPDWNSTVVDVRDPGWRDVVVRELAPSIMAKGFDGLFLDTADSALHLEKTDPQGHAGAADALVDMIAALRLAWPKARICLNRGMEIWPRTAKDLDFVLVEGLSSVYDRSAKAYRAVPEADRTFLLDAVKGARAANSALTALSLDYAAPGDTELIRAAIDFARAHEVVPYVATYRLDTVFDYTLGR